MIGIYHNKDFDGIASGAIMKYHHKDIKLFGYDYGDEFDFTILNKNEMVIMSDVSFDMDIMNKIADESASFMWIDHHISAINKYNKQLTNRNKIFILLDSNFSACELTWKAFNSTKEIPLIIQYLGEYDTFRTHDDKFRWNNIIFPFQLGMRSICKNVHDFPYHLLDGDFNFDSNEITIQSIIDRGKIILDYYNNNNEYICNFCSFEANINGYRALCINGFGLSSEAFKSKYDESKHDLMLCFCYIDGKYKITLYTTKDDVDCSLIAQSHGGGGHKKAAGCQVDKLPFN